MEERDEGRTEEMKVGTREGRGRGPGVIMGQGKRKGQIDRQVSSVETETREMGG